MKIRDVAVFVLSAVVLTNSVAMATTVPTQQVQSPVAAEFVIKAEEAVKNNHGMTDAQYKQELKDVIKEMDNQAQGSLFELKSAKGHERTSVTKHLVEALAIQELYQNELIRFEATGFAADKVQFKNLETTLFHNANQTRNFSQLEPGIQRMIELQDAVRPEAERDFNPNTLEHQQYISFLGCRAELNSLGKQDQVKDTCGPSPLSYESMRISTTDLVKQEKVGELFRNVMDSLKTPEVQARVDQGYSL